MRAWLGVALLVAAAIWSVDHMNWVPAALFTGSALLFAWAAMRP